MTVDTEDRVPVPHFKQRLWTELAHVHAEQASATSAGTRRPQLVAVAATATVAMAVATVAVLSSPDSDVETGGSYALLPASARFDENGDIVAQLIAATGEASETMIMHTVTQAELHSDEVWVDWPTMRYRGIATDANGVPREEVGGPVTDGTNDVFGEDLDENDVLRIVDHCRHDVSDETESAMTATPAWPFRDLPDGADDFTPPSELTAVVEGYQTVDGEQMPKVKVVETGEVLLVDPDTSLAVSGIVDPGTPDQQLTTYEYLPRSPENLELLTPPSVPDGYEHLDRGDSQGVVEAPPWDDDRPVPEPDCSDRAS